MKIRLLIVALFCFSSLPAMLLAQTGSQLPAAAALANPPQSKPQTAFEQQLMDTEKALRDALLRGDVAYAKEAIAEDFLSIGSNGDMNEKRELLESVHPAVHQPTQPILYDFKVIRLADNAAIVVYNAVFAQRHERYQHLSDTWVRENGQWKLKFRQTTLNLWSAHDL